MGSESVPPNRATFSQLSAEVEWALTGRSANVIDSTLERGLSYHWADML